MTFDPAETRKLARTIRSHSLRMVHQANASHIGTCFSSADILAVLYGSILKIDPELPDRPDRDRFLLSKGHWVACGLRLPCHGASFFSEGLLDTYCTDNTRLSGHSTHHGVPGVEVSSGSLGHGLSFGTGIALAAKRTAKIYRTFVLLSDGECDEGSIWEAAMFAPHHKLDNLIAIVDYNKIQSFGSGEGCSRSGAFRGQMATFNWSVQEVDGHDHAALYEVLSQVPLERGRPTVIIAHTIKGRRSELHGKSARVALSIAQCDPTGTGPPGTGALV